MTISNWLFPVLPSPIPAMSEHHHHHQSTRQLVSKSPSAKRYRKSASLRWWLVTGKVTFESGQNQGRLFRLQDSYTATECSDQRAAVLEKTTPQLARIHTVSWCLILKVFLSTPQTRQTLPFLLPFSLPLVPAPSFLSAPVPISSLSSFFPSLSVSCETVSGCFWSGWFYLLMQSRRVEYFSGYKLDTSQGNRGNTSINP